jgi:hypothetical protein
MEPVLLETPGSFRRPSLITQIYSAFMDLGFQMICYIARGV